MSTLNSWVLIKVIVIGNDKLVGLKIFIIMCFVHGVMCVGKCCLALNEIIAKCICKVFSSFVVSSD